jgi:hypothetical protein
MCYDSFEIYFSILVVQSSAFAYSLVLYDFQAKVYVTWFLSVYWVRNWELLDDINGVCINMWKERRLLLILGQLIVHHHQQYFNLRLDLRISVCTGEQVYVGDIQQNPYACYMKVISAFLYPLCFSRSNFMLSLFTVVSFFTDRSHIFYNMKALIRRWVRKLYPMLFLLVYIVSLCCCLNCMFFWHHIAILQLPQFSFETFL